MAKYNILTDKVNTYFTNNKITIANATPTNGTYVKGDVIISGSPSRIFGWICTVSGTPGTWIELKSAQDLTGDVSTHNHDNRYYTKTQTDQKYLPLAGGETTGHITMSNGRSYLFSKTNVELPNSSGGNVPAGTSIKLLAYDSSHNLSLGSGIYDNKITTGSTYVSGGNNMYLRISNPDGEFKYSLNGVNIGAISKTGFSGNSATATALQNTRTINGTNFDGSSNITTTKWGTSRNITIGNVTRSVDGSSDVSWNVGDMGAAPAVHGHPLGEITGGNSSSKALGTVYFKNSAETYVGRISCYHNTDAKTDYTTLGLYDPVASSTKTYLNLYPDYILLSKPMHSNAKYIQLDGNKLYMQPSSPGAIGAGNVWIKCG